VANEYGKNGEVVAAFLQEVSATDIAGMACVRGEAAVDDPPTVRVSPPPVSDELFGPTLLDPPGTTVLDPPGTTVLDPPTGHLSPPEHLDPPAEHPDRGPVWTGDTLPNNRPDVGTVPQSEWNGPRYDPSSFQYDGTPR
jgi:hypothetical protein